MKEKISIKIISMNMRNEISGESIRYNLAAGSFIYQMDGIAYKVADVSLDEVTIVLENNAEYYIKGDYSNFAKEIKLKRDEKVVLTTIAKPPSVRIIEALFMLVR